MLELHARSIHSYSSFPAGSFERCPIFDIPLECKTPKRFSYLSAVNLITRYQTKFEPKFFNDCEGQQESGLRDFSKYHTRETSELDFLQNILSYLRPYPKLTISAEHFISFSYISLLSYFHEIGTSKLWDKLAEKDYSIPLFIMSNYYLIMSNYYLIPETSNIISPAEVFSNVGMVRKLSMLSGIEEIGHLSKFDPPLVIDELKERFFAGFGKKVAEQLTFSIPHSSDRYLLEKAICHVTDLQFNSDPGLVPISDEIIPEFSTLLNISLYHHESVELSKHSPIQEIEPTFRRASNMVRISKRRIWETLKCHQLNAGPPSAQKYQFIPSSPYSKMFISREGNFFIPSKSDASKIRKINWLGYLPFSSSAFQQPKYSFPHRVLPISECIPILGIRTQSVLVMHWLQDILDWVFDLNISFQLDAVQCTSQVVRKPSPCGNEASIESEKQSSVGSSPKQGGTTNDNFEKAKTVNVNCSSGQSTRNDILQDVDSFFSQQQQSQVHGSLLIKRGFSLFNEKENFQLLVSVNFLEDLPHAIAILNSDYRISCIDQLIHNGIDVIIDSTTAIMLVYEQQMKQRENMKMKIVELIKASFQFSCIYMVFVRNERLKVLSNEILSALCQSLAKLQCKIIVRETVYNIDTIAKLIAGIVKYQNNEADRKLLKPELYRTRTHLTALQSDSQYLAQCHFLQGLPCMNIFLASLLLHKRAIQEVFSLDVGKLREILAMHSPHVQEMEEKLEFFLTAVNSYLL